MWDEEKIWRKGYRAGYSAAVGDTTNKFVEWLEANGKDNYTIEDLKKESSRFISLKTFSGRMSGRRK
jgi:hypothetical protein